MFEIEPPVMARLKLQVADKRLEFFTQLIEQLPFVTIHENVTDQGPDS